MVRAEALAALVSTARFYVIHRSRTPSVRPSENPSMNILQRIRGAVGTTLTWAAAWGLFGLAFRLVWPIEWTGMPSLSMLAASATSWLIPGAIAGLTFSLFLRAQPKRRLEDLTIKRMAVLGAVGGVAVPLLVGAGWLLATERSLSWMLQPLAQWAIAGAACAAGSLSVARRALTTKKTSELSAADQAADAVFTAHNRYGLPW